MIFCVICSIDNGLIKLNGDYYCKNCANLSKYTADQLLELLAKNHLDENYAKQLFKEMMRRRKKYGKNWNLIKGGK